MREPNSVRVAVDRHDPAARPRVQADVLVQADRSSERRRVGVDRRAGEGDPAGGPEQHTGETARRAGCLGASRAGQCAAASESAVKCLETASGGAPAR